MKLLLAPEAAALLRVSPNRVYELAARNIIPTVRIGRQLRFPEDRLLAWLEAGGTPLGEPAGTLPNSAVTSNAGVKR